MYAGKPKSGNGPHYIDTTENYIKVLVEKMEKRLPLNGRNISMDRLYTSFSIADWLLKKNIKLVGTLQANQIGIPDEIKDTHGRNEFSVTAHWEEEKKIFVFFPTLSKLSQKERKVFCYVQP